ncbi:MAG: Lrp/AsnC family transcriptional regulator [Rhodovibrionaceae bacterium]
MDKLDRRLLGLLQRDAKLTNAELGQRIGLSVSAVNERIRKLLAVGIIRGFEARLDAAALGQGICAFVLVLIERPEQESAFLAAVATTKQVQECHHVTGDYSYLLKLRVSSTAELERVIRQGLKALPGVVRTQTMIALSSPKETAAIDVAERSA